MRDQPDRQYIVLEHHALPWTALSCVARHRAGVLLAAAVLDVLVVRLAFGGLPDTWSRALGSAIAVVVSLSVGWLGWRLGRRLLAAHERTIGDRDRYEWRQALAARRTLLASWRKLRDHVDVEADPRPMLDRAMWELAGAIQKRAAVRASQDQLRAAHAQLAPDEPVVAELAGRIDQLDEARAPLDADIARRVLHLSGLAELCTDFLLAQAALEQGRQAARAADAALGAAATGVGDDSGQDIAERTSAVLGAYQDLQRQFAGPAG